MEDAESQKYYNGGKQVLSFQFRQNNEEFTKNILSLYMIQILATAGAEKFNEVISTGSREPNLRIYFTSV